MKIIDAHLHLFPSSPDTDAMAEKVGHRNSTAHLRQVYGELGIVHGVVMGNRNLDPVYHNYPADLFRIWPTGWRRTSSGRAAAG